MTRRGKVWAGLAPAILLLTALAGVRTAAQETRGPSFLAEKYEVSTSTRRRKASTQLRRLNFVRWKYRKTCAWSCMKT